MWLFSVVLWFRAFLVCCSGILRMIFRWFQLRLPLVVSLLFHTPHTPYLYLKSLDFKIPASSLLITFLSPENCSVYSHTSPVYRYAWFCPVYHDSSIKQHTHRFHALWCVSFSAFTIHTFLSHTLLYLSSHISLIPNSVSICSRFVLYFSPLFTFQITFQLQCQLVFYLSRLYLYTSVHFLLSKFQLKI